MSNALENFQRADWCTELVMCIFFILFNYNDKGAFEFLYLIVLPFI